MSFIEQEKLIFFVVVWVQGHVIMCNLRCVVKTEPIIVGIIQQCL